MNLTEILPHFNAGLNLIATVLLIRGFWLIKHRRELAHRNVMIACFCVSCLFLISYLTNYGLQGGNTKFPSERYPIIARFYYPFLAAHVFLAALVPFLALATIILGLRNKRESHKKLAKWTFPIWLFVSISGVMVYLMIRWIFRAE